MKQFNKEDTSMADAPSASKSSGLIIANNETLRSFLLTASQNPLLSEERREIASNLSSQTSIPYKSLRDLWSASPSSNRPTFLHLFSGSDFVFSSPKPKEKSRELKDRLRKLEEMLERNAYKELVKDITPKEASEPFSSYKDQLGFGLHVVLTMFTGYLVGYAAFRALFNHSVVMNAAGGIFGLVCGMLIETVLFIIKSTSQDVVSPSSQLKSKKRQ